MKSKIIYIISLILFFIICGINVFMLRDCYAKNLLDESEYTMKVVDKSFSDNEYNIILYNDTYKTYSAKNVKINEYVNINVGDTININQTNIDVIPNKYFGNSDTLIAILFLVFLFSFVYMIIILSVNEFNSFILMFISFLLSAFTYIFSVL